jgi:hypothetical protein
MADVDHLQQRQYPCPHAAMSPNSMAQHLAAIVSAE